MNKHERINYVELQAFDIPATKAFFTSAFNWSFEDYGADYTSFSNQGLNGGFFKSALVSKPDQGAALIIFYSEDLTSTQIKVEDAGGKIIRAIFDFPGGKRFHFIEPSGNEFAVWSDI